MALFISVIIAFALDKLFAEPKRGHPLVFFGALVERIEAKFNSKNATRWHGVLAYAVAVLPWVLVGIILQLLLKPYLFLDVLVSGVFLYIAIGWQSLITHAKNIYHPLIEGELTEANAALSLIVSRDTGDLNENEIAKAATESVLENGADAIFAALFWFLILGIPGVILYRCSNTLDAMWGYKTEKYIRFGWCAARVDDLLNYIPARLTALSYALMGNFSGALKCWKEQGRQWKSPNAGPVMAAGAGALNVSLGGAARYHNELQQRMVLGPEETEHTKAGANSINEACRLVNFSLVLWVVILGIALL
ncbi:adenosylcobinamide-phosphate synthase CbiB [Reinekea thalattae]|uniref:Cobalamin biosynthesis protein CobD n=1 Tax=Reinekea thalattae TaxID=2593301 RepID=A0A5C8Z6S5_9GAMM|nr:adenosylcobinamide-phosphate synthase CbiB [Reinekea thalattae]TXR53642.1 cobalamin biosynthesis protein [Reinekea thalattae]